MYATDPSRSEPILLATGEPSIEVVRDLGHPDGADRVRYQGSLRDQNVHLAQLGHNLFGGMSLLAHCDPPSALTSHTSGRTTPLGADHRRSSGGLTKRLAGMDPKR